MLSQAALLEQVSNLQPLLDSTYIRGEFHFVGHINTQQNNVCFVVLYSWHHFGGILCLVLLPTFSQGFQPVLNG